MKREILCPECNKNLRIQFPTDTPYPGEHIKFVDGKAKADMICDQCVKDLEPGDDCTAMSIWTDYGGIPYYEWEPDYITLNEQEKKA